MDALSAFLRHIKLEPLIDGKVPLPQDTKALTAAPIAAAGASDATQSHADTTGADVSDAVAKRVAAQTRLPISPERALIATGDATASSYTKLSSNATLLGQLIHAAQSSAAELPAPLPLNVASSGTAQVAQTLNQSLAQSGLFYESHLVEWAEGGRSLDALRLEPQNRLAVAPHAAPALKADAMQMSTMQMTNNASDTPLPQNANAASLMPEALQPVVREQLDALDFQRVLWQGEVWPRQHAELEIREEARGSEQGQESKDESVWHSTLNIDLPGLGPVTAHIMLSAEGAHINLRANATAIAALRANGAQFQAAMQDAGIGLRQLDLGEERGND